MPEHLGSALNSKVSPFPLAKQKGSHYVPPPDKVEDGVLLTHAVQTILVEPQALYELWRDVASAPLWQEHIVSVTEKSSTLSHWVAGDPDQADGKRIEWDSQIVEDFKGAKIAWKSVTDGVDEQGTVTFTAHPTGRGTIVTLEERAHVPGGAIGNAIAGVVERSPRQTVVESLRHFKELAESGEVPSVKGQPHGPRGVTGKVKEWMFGETNPTPPGSSTSA